MDKYDFGIIGLGVMGQNLALNIEDKGFTVAGLDLSEAQAQAAAAKWAGKRMTTVKSIEELVQSLTSPRRILMMVPAGKPVDDVINALKPHLATGDILIDGGNTFFPDTDRRSRDLESRGINYIGSGVSGGEDGALHGPALMPGGQHEAYEKIEPIFNAIAAKVNGEPCSGYIGKGGAGHYVKMVHNGIEYGMMQMIVEAYDLMKSALGLSAADMSVIFDEWNKGELNSYLIEITAAVLAKKDPETGQPVVDLILDKAGQKGTGKWTSQNALDLGVAIPTINAALEGRILSSVKDDREAASKILHGPAVKYGGDWNSLLAAVRDALHLAFITCYAQGFSLMREASREYGYNLNFEQIARGWRGGCIIRSKMLSDIMAAFQADPTLTNLMTAPQFAPKVNALAPALRQVCEQSAALGVPVLAHFASLGYIDSYRSARMPQNLLQGQRDYFGAHTYERVDKPRGQKFHTHWI